MAPVDVAVLVAVTEVVDAMMLLVAVVVASSVSEGTSVGASTSEVLAVYIWVLVDFGKGSLITWSRVQTINAVRATRAMSPNMLSPRCLCMFVCIILSV